MDFCNLSNIFVLHDLFKVEISKYLKLTLKFQNIKKIVWIKFKLVILILKIRLFKKGLELIL